MWWTELSSGSSGGSRCHWQPPRRRKTIASGVLTPQPEGGYTVTSPALPGLVTEGDSLEQALANVEDALRAMLELYEDTGRPIPSGLVQDPEAGVIHLALPEAVLVLEGCALGWEDSAPNRGRPGGPDRSRRGGRYRPR